LKIFTTRLQLLIWSNQLQKTIGEDVEEPKGKEGGGIEFEENNMTTVNYQNRKMEY